MAATLDIQVEDHDGVTLVTLSGPVDSATIETFKAQLGPIFKKKNARILIHASDLSYINSNGIGLLMKYRRNVYVDGGRMAMCCVSSRVLHALQMLRIDQKLKLYDNLDEAMAAMH